LGDEEAVERIAVMQRQIVRGLNLSEK